ncbi:MAG TPA: hypothetical protein VF335_01425 [Chitinivibrionales bacterium]
MKIFHATGRKTGLFLALMGGMTAAFAAPQISVDSATFDLGVMYEGKLTTATHAFKVKNTGDSILRIQQVKPG